MNNALIRVLKDDPEFGERLLKKASEIKKDKHGILKLADQYAKEHQDEIDEGTRRYNKLLSDGTAKGLTTEEVKERAEVYNGSFMPSVYTPILNLLYFLLKETDDVDGKMEVLREEYNQKYGQLQHEDGHSEYVKDAPDMVTYLYGNMTLEQFNILKKLKRLSKNNDNEHESFLAWKRCNELCTKYGLEFDRIPS